MINHIPEVAKMFSVKIGEEFKIYEMSNMYMFDKYYGLVIKAESSENW